MPYTTTKELSSRMLLASMAPEAAINTLAAPTRLITPKRWEIKDTTPPFVEPMWNFTYGQKAPINFWKQEAAANIEVYAATEHMAVWLQSIFGSVSAGLVGTGYLRTYAAPATTTTLYSAWKTVSLYEANMDSVNGYGYAGKGFWGQRFGFKTATNQPLLFNADMIGHSRVTSSTSDATAANSLTSVSETPFTANDFILKMAAIDSAPAQVYVPEVYSLEISVDTGRERNPAMGQLTQNASQPFIEGDWRNITATLVMPRTPDSKFLYDGLIGTSPAAVSRNFTFSFYRNATTYLDISMGAIVLATPSVDRGGMNERLSVTFQGWMSTNTASPIKIAFAGGGASVT